MEAVFNDLKNENLPLTDEAGQPLARRPMADRLLAVTNLRQTARQLATKPEDLVLATTLVIRTESLADDLFDLSQMAYDNDREELGNRLSTLQITMEENKELLADYLLALAAEKQNRLQQLEKEVDELHQKLKEGMKQQVRDPMSNILKIKVKTRQAHHETGSLIPSRFCHRSDHSFPVWLSPKCTREGAIHAHGVHADGAR